MHALDTALVAAEPALKPLDQSAQPASGAPQCSLIQELPMDLLDHIGGGNGLTLII
jgi:hypothetical protein